MNQEAGPRQTVNLPAPWSWPSQSPELGEISAVISQKKKNAPCTVYYVPDIYHISYNTANGSYGLTILIFSPLIFIYLLGTGSHISNL